MTRFGRALVAAAVPVTVVGAVDPGGLSPFGPAKWLVVTTSVLAAVAVLAARARRTDGRAVGAALVRRPMAAWAALLAVVAVAAGAGRDPVHAWIGTPERRFGAAAWLLCALAFVAGQLLGPPGRRGASLGAAAAAGLAGAWASAEVLGWEPIALVGAGDRPVGPLGSSAYLGAAMALLGPGCVGVALGDGDRRVRALAAAAGTVAAVGLVTSGARAAWLGVAAAVVVVVLVRRPLPARRLAALGLAATVAAGALASVTGVAGRLPDLVRDDRGGVVGRVDEWRVAGRVVVAHPLLGVGPEGYRIDFGRHVDDTYERRHGRDPLPDRAHAAPLDIAVTTGLPGLAAWAALVTAVGVHVLRALRRAPPAIAGTAAGLVAYGAQSLALFPLAELDPVAWLLAGAVSAATAAPAETVAWRPPRLVPALAGAMAVVALVSGGLDVVANRRAREALAAVADGRPASHLAAAAADLRPDVVLYRLVAARTLTDRTGGSDLERAIAQVGHALDVSPGDPVARAEEARLLLARARRTRAPTHLRAARHALEELAADDPRHAEVLLRLGVVRALDGAVAAAQHARRRAEHLAPRSAAAATDLAISYAEQGRWVEARAAARRALARDPHSVRARVVLEQADGT